MKALVGTAQESFFPFTAKRENTQQKSGRSRFFQSPVPRLASGCGVSGLTAQTHNDIHIDDFHALRRLRHIGNGRLSMLAMRNIEDHIFPFEEEVLVIGDIGVEIGFGPFHRDDAQHARFRKLVQRVVYGGERDRNVSHDGFLVKVFRGQVAVALSENQARKCNALARGAQTGFAKPLFHRDRRVGM